MAAEGNKQLDKLKWWAEQSGLSYDYLRRACLDGRLKHIRCGVKIMVRSDWFEEFIEAEACGGAGEAKV